MQIMVGLQQRSWQGTWWPVQTHLTLLALNLVPKCLVIIDLFGRT